MGETQELTGPLIKDLNQTGGWAERMNSGIAKRGRYFIHLHGEGTADILFFPRALCWSGRGSLKPAQPIWIETKQPKGHTNKAQVDAQAAFKDKVEALGHRYLRVTSIQECMEALGL
jgi:hypothetical protein